MQNPGCKNDCLQRPISRSFRALGALVGTHPWPFLLLPLALTGAFGPGLMYITERETNELEVQFTPINGPAKQERRLVRERFTTDDGQRFSPQRMTAGGTYAKILVAAAREGDSLLTRDAFSEILALDTAVRELLVSGYTLKELCARSRGDCWSANPLLAVVQGDLARFEALRPNLTYPLFQGRVFLGFFVEGVTLGPGDRRARPLREARLMRLIYFLQEDDVAWREVSKRWVNGFLERFPEILDSLHFTSIRAVYITSLSRQKELKKLAVDVFPLIFIAYILTIFYSIVSCGRLDCVRTKIWIGFFGVIATGLSVVSSFGLLLFFGVPFAMTAANAPFLILATAVPSLFFIDLKKETHPAIILADFLVLYSTDKYIPK